MSGTLDTLSNGGSFTSGDLVISLSGDGANTGSYGDNQASPVTLYELTISGTYEGELVLPQTTTVVNGVTEYAISSEYGSSSEGSLELSADGHSLVIAGYGINAVTYDQGGAAVYGNAALAQTTSVPGGQYTAVARVIADISASGTVDTSTALYNVFNTNNPRSVATVNGTSFYIAGQGVSGDSTQGLFYAQDGASTATAINTTSDDRTVEIINGAIYVSRDSTQASGGSIADISGEPTSSSTLASLTGISGTLTVSKSQVGALADAAFGSNATGTINISPENYFYVSANTNGMGNEATLYVADGGAPKEKGIADGGLQKWTENSTTGSWTLDYTLTSGLNLVSATAISGSTGLIGLTGVVNGGNVSFYTTNETVADLNQTYVYTITDSLAATTASSTESFTAIYTAPADTNVRGISFAPTPAGAPTSNASTVTIGSQVSSGGLIVANGETLIVSNGGTAGAAMITSGGFEIVSAGGVDSGTTVLNGATQTVYGSATANLINGTQIISGGAANVTSDSILNGGVVEVATTAGSIISGISVQNTGELILSSTTATVSATTIAGGTVELLSAGAALVGGVSFTGAGTIELATGTSITGTINGFETGDVIDLQGFGTGASLASSVSGTLVTETVTSGGSSISFTFANPVTSGVAAFNDSGIQLSADGSGGVEVIFAGPALTVVSNGVTSSSLTIANYHALGVDSGGSASSIVVQAGGYEYVYSGGTDTSTTIQAGGYELVSGTATGDLVYGTQNVSAASAVVLNETVFNGGAIDLFLKGAVGSNITVSSGGALNISGNAVASNTTISNGGTLTLQSPKATLSGTVSLVGTTTIDVTGAISAGYGDLAVISGFGAGDVIDLATIASASTVTLAGSIVSGALVETVTSGGTSESYTFALANNGKIVLGHDASGDVELISGAGTSASLVTTISSGVYSGVVSSGLTVNITSPGGISGATIQNGGTVSVGAGVTDSGTTISNGGNEIVYGSATGDAIYGSQTLSGPATGGVTNETVYNGGVLSLTSKVETAGNITVNSGGTFSLNGAITASGTVLSGGTAILNSTSATISGLNFEGATNGVVEITSVKSAGPTTGLIGNITSAGVGDKIIFTSGDFGAGATSAVLVAGGVTSVTVTSGSTHDTYDFAGSGYAFSFTSAASGAGFAYTLDVTASTACYCRGTAILTEHGEVAVENLQIGDLLRTKTGKLRPIKWIGTRAYDRRFAASNADIMPICIKEGALAENTPHRDLWVSPLHAMYLHGALVPAGALVNGTTITQAREIERVEYFHIEMETHDVIFAEGALSETFVDDNSRGMFHNAAEFSWLYPESRRSEARYCAPRVEGGHALEAIRSTLATRITRVA